MPNVTVRPPASINVRVGPPTAPIVQTINYSSRTLKGSADLNIGHANTGDVIVYQANTNSFVVLPIQNELGNFDAGLF